MSKSELRVSDLVRAIVAVLLAIYSLGCDAPGAGGVGTALDPVGGEPEDANVGHPDVGLSSISSTDFLTLLARDSICFGSAPLTGNTGLAAAFGVFDSMSNTDMTRCILSAADCPGVLACRGYRLAQCSEDEPGTCDGTISRYCLELFSGYSALQERDCATLAPHGACVTDAGAGFEAVCAAGFCNGGERCDGDTLVYCNQGYEMRVSCSDRIGFGCTESEGTASCSPAGEACERTHCIGSAIEACEDGVVEGRFDCSKFAPGLTCVDTGDDIRCGAPEGHLVCNPGNETGQCDGTQLQMCVGGGLVALDCATFPGGRCENGAGDARCFVPGWTLK